LLWKKIRRIILILFIGTGSVWIVASTWSEIAYQRSRPKTDGSLNSYLFLSFGIKPTMTEAEVNRLLHQADRILPHQYSVNPLWTGYYNTYEIGYGLDINLIFLKTKLAFIKENIDVYFDPAGRPKKLQIFINRLDWSPKWVQVDLDRQQVIIDRAR
jgi:hypothetical protein